MANLSNINNILRTGSLGVGINRDPLGAFEISSATKPGVKMFNTSTNGKTYEAYSDTNGNYIIYDQDADDNRFVINTSGNATFSGSVQIGATAGYTTISQGAFFTKGGGDMYTANLLAGAAASPMFRLQRNDVEKYNIGLDVNDNLAFINASGDAKMSITSGGNVGIGTTSPQAPLQIGTHLTTAPADTGLCVSNRKSIRINDADGNYAYGVYIKQNYSGSSYLILGTTHGAVDTDALFVKSGNVGIGTDSPGYKLDTNGVGAFGVGNYRTYVSGDSGGSFIEFGTDADNDALGVLGTFASAMVFDTNQASGFKWRYAGNDRMTLTAGGNLGIGAGSGGYKLEVKDGQDSSLFSGLVVERSANTTAVCLNAVGGALNLNTNSSMPLKFRIGNTSMQTINTNGGRAYAGFGGWRMFEYIYNVSIANGATIDLLQNVSAHTDLHMVQIAIRMFHSGRTYYVGSGVVGGYGMNLIGSGSGVTNGGLTSASVSTGIRKLQISQSSGFTADTSIYIQFRLDNPSGINVLNGTLSSL